MSNTDDAKPLDPTEVVPEEFEDEDLYNGKDDDGLSPADDDVDGPGAPTTAGRENQAGTEQVDPGKFRRE